MVNQRVATMTNKVKPYIAKSYIYTYLQVMYLFLGDVFTVFLYNAGDVFISIPRT